MTAQFDKVLSLLHENKNVGRILEQKVEVLERRLGGISDQEKSKFSQTVRQKDLLEGLRSENQQLSEQVSVLRAGEQQLLAQIQQLTESVEYLHNQNNGFQQQVQTLQSERPVLDTQDSNLFWVRQKERKLTQLQQDKQKQDQLISRAHSLIKCQESQHLFMELHRVAGEISRKEEERCSFEFDLDDLERQLKHLVQDREEGEEQKSLLTAQDMRRQIGSLGARIQTCDADVQTLYQRQESVEQLMRELEQKHKAEQFSGVAADTQSITILAKESASLRNQLLERDHYTKQLEDQLNRDKQDAREDRSINLSNYKSKQRSRDGSNNRDFDQSRDVRREVNDSASRQKTNFKLVETPDRRSSHEQQSASFTMKA